MNLEEKSEEVRRVFQELDLEIREFLDQSKLSCLPGCGFCCSNPKVSATVLEFLPWAVDVCRRGSAESVLELLEKSGETDPCIVFKATSPKGDKGYCSDYQNRGLICRLFSSSYRMNKLGRKEIITCRKIKEAKPEQFVQASEAINQGMLIPSSAGTYSQLYNIDYQLAKDQMPINKALKRALEIAQTYFYYRDLDRLETPETL